MVWMVSLPFDMRPWLALGPGVCFDGAMGEVGSHFSPARHEEGSLIGVAFTCGSLTRRDARKALALLQT